MKQKFKDYYKDIVLKTAELSRAQRLKVGAIAVKDNRIISTGYNGTPTGWDNNCESKIYWDPAFEDLHSDELDSTYPYEDKNGRYRLETKPEVLHAEHNLIAKLARSVESSEGADVFCTVGACLECAKLIHSAGIKSFYYINDYRTDDGIRFLKKCGITVEKLGE
jgi:dCMP deaminase